MAQLIFRNRNGQERTIAEVHSYKDINVAIDAFIADCNKKWPNKKPFKRYYTRIWNENGRAKFDVGSWTEFFYLDCPWPESAAVLEKEYEVWFK